MLAAVILPRRMRGELEAKRKRKIALEFKDSLYGLSSALRAGRSLEGAFEAAFAEMDPKSFPNLYGVWEEILARTRLHQRLEDVLYEFAMQTGIDEILSFAQILAISKRSDGNITKIIESTAGLLQEKIEMQQELAVLLSQKKMEQRIMNLMPFFVIGMLLLMSPDYVLPLYTTLQGRLIMTVCIALSVISVAAAGRIADIEM